MARLNRRLISALTALLIVSAACTAPPAQTLSPLPTFTADTPAPPSPSEPAAAQPSPTVSSATAAPPTSSPSPSPTSPAPSATPAPAATPVAAAPLDDLRAGRFERTEVDVQTSVTGLVHFHDAFFAATWIDQYEGVVGGRVLTSVDGRSWSTVDSLPAHDFGLTAGADRLLAWTFTGAVWSTSDGTDWQLLTEQGFPVAADAHPRIGAVTALEDGFAAAGAYIPRQCMGSCPGAFAIWLSSDGEAWQLATRGPDQGLGLSGLASGPDLLVAVGPWDEGVPPKDIWVSPDAVTWSRAPDIYPRDRVFEEHGVNALVGGSRVFALAVALLGRDGDRLESVGLWELTGGGWVDRTTDELVRPAGYERVLWEAMTETPDGYVIVGGARRTADGMPAALAWVSPDGVDWAITELPGGTGAHAVTYGEERIVIAGTDAGQGVMWVAGR